jgi:hypothetical protein
MFRGNLGSGAWTLNAFFIAALVWSGGFSKWWSFYVALGAAVFLITIGVQARYNLRQYRACRAYLRQLLSIGGKLQMIPNIDRRSEMNQDHVRLLRAKTYLVSVPRGCQFPREYKAFCGNSNPSYIFVLALPGEDAQSRFYYYHEIGHATLAGTMMHYRPWLFLLTCAVLFFHLRVFGGAPIFPLVASVVCMGLIFMMDSFDARTLAELYADSFGLSGLNNTDDIREVANEWLANHEATGEAAEKAFKTQLHDETGVRAYVKTAMRKVLHTQRTVLFERASRTPEKWIKNVPSAGTYSVVTAIGALALGWLGSASKYPGHQWYPLLYMIPFLIWDVGTVAKVNACQDEIEEMIAKMSRHGSPAETAST